MSCRGSRADTSRFTSGWGWDAGFLAAFAQVLDGVDRQFSRLTGTQSRGGAFLDSVMDRYFDAALMIGMVVYLVRLSAALPVSFLLVLAFLAISGAGLISYTTARAETLGFPMGKPTLSSKGTRTSVIVLCAWASLVWPQAYVELLKQLGLEPEQYKPLIAMQDKWDSKIESLAKTLSNVKASMRRKEIALRNLDGLLESDGFDSAAYSHKRNDFLLEIKALDQKLRDTQKELDEHRHRKSEEAEFAKKISGTNPFKALTYKLINLPFADKYRLLHGILDGPIVMGHSTPNPHVQLDPEDEMMKILEGIGMTIIQKYPLFLTFISE